MGEFEHLKLFAQQLMPLLVAVVVLATMHPPARVVAYDGGWVELIVSVGVDPDPCADVDERVK